MSLDLKERQSQYRKVVAAFHLKAYNQAMLVSSILPQLAPRDIHIIFEAYRKKFSSETLPKPYQSIGKTDRLKSIP